jgi:hypothetical protein
MLFNNRSKKLNPELLDEIMGDFDEETFVEERSSSTNHEPLNLLQKVVKEYGLEIQDGSLKNVIQELELEIKNRVHKIKFFNKSDVETATVLFLASPENHKLLELLQRLKLIFNSL